MTRDMTPGALDDQEVLRAVIAAQNEIAACGLELDATMTLICDRAMQLTGAAAAAIEMAEGEEMVCCWGSDSAADQVGKRFRVNSSLSGLCLRRREVLACDDARLDLRVDGEAYARAGELSMICVPLDHRENCVGVLRVHSPRPRAFDDAAIEVLGLMSAVIGAQVQRAGDYDAIRLESRQDVLTGLGNRRAYGEQLYADVAIARRYLHPFSLCLLNIDAFAETNARYGRHGGDEALRRVARALEALRGGDQAFRVGGDEFALLLPHTEVEGARTLAVRLRDRLWRAFPLAPGISVSIGFAELDGEDAAELHAAAEAGLHAAKQGRPVYVPN